MITTTIQEMAAKKGIKNAYNLGLALRVSPAIAARLWSGDFQRVDKDTLNTVCEYFGVQPGKFLHYEPDEQKAS